MQVAHKNYGQYFTAIEATNYTCDPCPTNHCRHQQNIFIVILNETLWLWLFSSCFCFVHLGSHFAHLLWFCPKLGLCWFRWMPSGEICMHKGGGGSSALHCTTISTSTLQVCAHAVCKYLLDGGRVSLRTILYWMQWTWTVDSEFYFVSLCLETFTLRSHCVLALHNVWHKHLSGGRSFCAESTHCTYDAPCTLGCTLYSTVMHSSALYHISVNCEV